MNLNRKLILGILLNMGFTFIEMTIGYFSGSLSLITDAICNLTDVISLIISFFALKLSSRKPDDRRTFGYGRISVLASLLNLSILLVVIIGISYQAYYKFFNPEPIEGSMVMIVGLLGIIINGLVAASLFNHKDHLTIRTALFNLILDVFASFGALISGIVIMFTNKTFIDPIISIAIALTLLVNAFKIFLETIDILLESVPKNLNLHQIRSTIQQFDAVQKIDDLHIWSIASNQPILICTIYLNHHDCLSGNLIVQEIKTALQEQFNFYHITIELKFTEDNAGNVANSQQHVKG